MTLKHLTLLVILFLSAFSMQAQDNVQPAEIPSFTFFTLADNSPFTQRELITSGRIVLVFFDPGCSHCQEEIGAIGENLDKFKDASFYFITMQDKPLILEFVGKYGKKLKGKNNVTFLHDGNYEFIGKFNPTEYPSLYVYSAANKRLVKYLHGPTKINTILAAVNP